MLYVLVVRKERTWFLDPPNLPFPHPGEVKALGSLRFPFRDVAAIALRFSLFNYLPPFSPISNTGAAMTTRKLNEYLDIGGSDEEDASGYDSEAAQATKGGRTAPHPIPSSKRQRLNGDKSDSEDSQDIQDSEIEPDDDSTLQGNAKAQPSSTSPADHPSTEPSAKSKPKSTSSKSLSPSKDKAPKRGVIYLSRIPPFMRPHTVRQLLSTHGTITRLFLTPEAPASYASRKKSGGNKKRSFIDGWVEFSRKKDAKICVEAINGHIVGGKKGGWYRDDVWNAKYLRGFGWEDLMESVRREEREREEKIRVGVSREGKERREFLRGVEMGKVEEGKRKKKEDREARKGGQSEVDQAAVPKEHTSAPPKQSFERRFKQNEVTGKKEKGSAQSDDVKRVLSKIF